MEKVIENTKEETNHNWKCSESPGSYLCHCGATGVWNMDLQKIEVLEPMPYETFRRRHFISREV